MTKRVKGNTHFVSSLFRSPKQHIVKCPNSMYSIVSFLTFRVLKVFANRWKFTALACKQVTCNLITNRDEDKS